MDDGDAFAAARTDRPPLHPLLGIPERSLISAIRDGYTFDAHLQACEVHHREHVLETAVLLTHQVPDSAFLVAVGHDAGRARVDPQLVLDRHALDVVARAEAAVRV